MGKGRRGFSLIELMIALGLSGVVLLTAGTMLLQAYANEAAYREQNEAQRNARAALDIVIDDLREASAGSVRGMEFPTEDETTYMFLWNNEIALGQIHYWIDGTDLIRKVSADEGSASPGFPPVVVARNIRRFTVKPDESATPVAVMTVTVTTTVGDDPDDENDTYSTVTLQSDVTMRNSLF